VNSTYVLVIVRSVLYSLITSNRGGVMFKFKKQEKMSAQDVLNLTTREKIELAKDGQYIHILIFDTCQEVRKLASDYFL
jgi:hypothetical protein